MKIALPKVLYRVSIHAKPDTKVSYLDPAGKTFASHQAALDHADKGEKRGYEVHLFRAEPVWTEVAR